MAVTIVNVSDFIFSIDGIEYNKNYQSVVFSDKLEITNVYDSKDVRVKRTIYSDFTVNGSSYGSAALLQSALIGVLFTSYQQAFDERLDNLEENQVTGVEVYSTFASLPVTGTLLVSYKVSNDGDSSLNGYYHWSGAAYVKDASLANGVVEDGDVDPTSGDTVFKGLISKEKETLNKTLNSLKNNFYSIYNGTSSKSDLDTTYTLQNNGDYIKFDVALKELGISGGYKAMGIVGEVGTTNSNIGFWFDGNLYVRDAGGTWLSLIGFNEVAVADEVLSVELRWVGGNIDTYKNGIYQKTITGGILNIENIGSSYSTFFYKGGVKNIELSHSGGSIVNIGSPYIYDGSVNVDVDFQNSDDAYLTGGKNNKIENSNSFMVPTKKLSEESGFLYDRFNGASSIFNLPSDIKLAENGDYFELDFKSYEPIVASETLGIIGKPGTPNTFGFLDENELRFRGESDAGYSQMPTVGGFHEWATYRLEVVNAGTQYEVKKNGIQIGLFTKTSDYVIANIGAGYTSPSSKIDVRNVKIHTLRNDFDIPILSFSGLEKTDLDLIDSNPNNFAKTYVDYDPIGSVSGDELFIAYVQNEADKNYYFGFQVFHLIDLAELVYSNQYRVGDCDIYIFDGVKMSPTNIGVLTGGESEWVYRIADRDDFTGGFHGDEIFSEINFYIDNIRLTASELSSSFPLRPCSEFKYIQKSTTHETAISGVANPLHPIEGIHFKNTVFKNSGYETNNRITWQNNLPIQIGYNSLVSIDNIFGEFCQSDDYIITALDELGGDKIREVNDNAHLWSETEGLSATIKSEWDVFNTTSEQWIWDTVPYNKYYRDTGNKAVVTNEEWNAKTTVKFLKS